MRSLLWPFGLRFTWRAMLAAAIICAACATIVWLNQKPRNVEINDVQPLPSNNNDVQLIRCNSINLLDAKAELRKMISENRPSLKSQINIGCDPDHNLLFLSGQKDDLALIYSLTNNLGWEKEPVCRHIFCDTKSTFYEQIESGPPAELGSNGCTTLLGLQFGSSSFVGSNHSRIEDNPDDQQYKLTSHLAIESTAEDFAQIDLLFRVNRFDADESSVDTCDGTVELRRKMKVAYGTPFELRIADFDNPNKTYSVQWTIHRPMSMAERNKLSSQQAQIAQNINSLVTTAIQAKESLMQWLQ